MLGFKTIPETIIKRIFRFLNLKDITIGLSVNSNWNIHLKSFKDGYLQRSKQFKITTPPLMDINHHEIIKNAIAETFFLIGDEIKITNLSGASPRSVTYKMFLNHNNYVVKIINSRMNEQQPNWEKEKANEMYLTHYHAALGISPTILYMNIEEGVIIMNCINNNLNWQGNISDAQLEALSVLLRKLHTGPKFKRKNSISKCGLYDTRIEESKRFISQNSQFDFYFEAIRLYYQLVHEISDHGLAHNDLNNGNILFDNAKFWLIDWECAGPGDFNFDLASFVVLYNLTKSQEDIFLQKYFQGTLSSMEKARYNIAKQLAYLRFSISLLGNLFPTVKDEKLEASSRVSQPSSLKQDSPLLAESAGKQVLQAIVAPVNTNERRVEYSSAQGGPQASLKTIPGKIYISISLMEDSSRISQPSSLKQDSPLLAESAGKQVLQAVVAPVNTNERRVEYSRAQIEQIVPYSKFWEGGPKASLKTISGKIYISISLMKEALSNIRTNQFIQDLNLVRTGLRGLTLHSPLRNLPTRVVGFNLPLAVTKNIISFLDKKSLHILKRLNKEWLHLSQQAIAGKVLMIPKGIEAVKEEKQLSAVTAALYKTFIVGSTEEYTIEPLKGGLSDSAFLYKIIVGKNCYVLRILSGQIQRKEIQQEFSTAYLFGHYGISPKVHYSSVLDRVIIMDYIPFQRGWRSTLTQHQLLLIEELVASLHNYNLAKFIASFGKNYRKESSIAKVLALTSKYPILNDFKLFLAEYEKIKAELAPFMHNDLIHNDLNPGNILFCDEKFYLIDWESSRQGNVLSDLAALTIYLGLNEKKEAFLLRAFFGTSIKPADIISYYRFKQLAYLECAFREFPLKVTEAFYDERMGNVSIAQIEQTPRFDLHKKFDLTSPQGFLWNALSLAKQAIYNRDIGVYHSLLGHLKIETTAIQKLQDELLNEHKKLCDGLTKLARRHPELAVQCIIEGTSQEIRDSLLVRLVDPRENGWPYLNYDGLYVQDALTQASLSGTARTGVFLYPFPAPKVTAVMVYHATVRGELYIVLIESNYSQQQSAFSGYLLPGGHFNAICPQGSEGGTSRVIKVDRDAAEEAIQRGQGNAYNKNDLNSARRELPLLPDRHHTSLKDCAIQEGIEETGINLPARMYNSTTFVTAKEYTSRSRRIHIIINYFETYCGDFSSPQELPKLAPIDTHEIKNALWVKVSELKVNAANLDFSGVPYNVSYSNHPLAKHHLYALNQVITTIRDREIARLTNNVITTRDALIAAWKKLNAPSLEKRPPSEFGLDASLYHKDALQLASKFAEMISNKTKASHEESAYSLKLLKWGIFGVLIGTGAVLGYKKITQQSSTPSPKLG